MFDATCDCSEMLIYFFNFIDQQRAKGYPKNSPNPDGIYITQKPNAKSEHIFVIPTITKTNEK